MTRDAGENRDEHLEMQANCSHEDEDVLKTLTNTKRGAPDGGWGWLCTMGRFYIHFLIFGMKSAFGIFYIELIEYFDTDRTTSAWIGSLASGLILLSAPISGILTEKYGCRITTMLGGIIAAIGLFLSWFSTSLIFLGITYGVMTGIGLGLTFIPSAIIVIHYFDKRRGVASALGSTGGSVGSILLPIIFTKLLEAYGWRGSLCILSGLALNCVVFGALFRTPEYLVRERRLMQISKKEKSGNEKINIRDMFSVMRNVRFVLFVLSTFCSNIGLVVPLVHLPDMALQRGVSKTNTAFLLSIMGIAGGILKIPVAWIGDSPKVNRMLIQACVLLICGVATILAPFVCHTYLSLAVYSAVQGGFHGISGTFLSVLVADIVGVREANKGFTFLVFFAGVPSLVSSPIAGWLYDETQAYAASFCYSGAAFLAAGFLSLSVFLIGLYNKHHISR